MWTLSLLSLRTACHKKLENSSTYGAGLTTQDEDTLISNVKKLVVRSRNKLASAVELLKLRQDADQTVESYLAKMRAVARQCDFKVTKPCSHNPPVDVEIDYSENVILRQLLVGMHDEELQRDLLTKENLTLPVAEKAIADMEAAKRSQEALQNKPAGVNSLSQYKKDKKEKGKDDGKCGYCGQERHGEANKERKKQCKAFGKDCSKCGKADHFEKVCRSKAPPATPASSVQENSVDAFIFKVKTDTKTAGSHNISMLSYNKKLGDWVSKEKEEKENLPVSMEVCHSSLVTLSKKYKKQEIKSSYNTHKATSLADTGATVTCGGLDILKGLGMKQEALLPTKVVLRAANGQKLTTLGTVPVKLSISSYGESTRTLVYIAKELSRLLVCKDDLISLGSIPASFPFPPTEKINGIEFEKAPTLSLIHI